MHHLRPYSLFEHQSSHLSPEQQAFLNEWTRGIWLFNPDSGLVDVEGSVNFYGKNQVSMLRISFGQVKGDFNCGDNFLKSLTGSPKVVFDNYTCGGNSLTSLEGAPEVVGGNFDCSSVHSQITSLIGSPWIVGGKFDCSYCRLTSLVGAPLLVDDFFVCEHFTLYGSEWNPVGWEKIMRGYGPSKDLMQTIPYLEPEFWLELHRQDRQKFNDVWVYYRKNTRVRETSLFQKVESALSGRSKSNLDDLEMLGDFM